MKYTNCQTARAGTSKRRGAFFGNRGNSSFFSPRTIQARLAIGPVDDHYEREADAVAGKVMQTRDAGSLQTGSSPAGIQRCAKCDAEDESKKVQLKGEASAGSGALTATPLVHDALAAGGKRLDTGTRDFMETRFGQDFHNVQVHNDALAHQSSKEINALAYTHGDHVVFGEGQYQPSTYLGKHLLAHELTHVLQQKNLSQSVQRDVTEPDKACPADYDKGEKDKSRNEPGILGDDVIETGSGELVIADFGVDWRHPKESLKKNALLRYWLDRFESDGDYHVSVHGYSDCIGEADDNAYLRSSRAKNIYGLFGSGTKSRTKEVSAAAAHHYFDGNADAISRSKNRSVVITFWKQITGDPIQIEGDKQKAKFICGPDVTQPLKSVVADTDKIFWSWSSDQRDDACDALDAYTTGGDAWDVFELHNNDWINKDFRPECATAKATPACGSSIQVGDQCYYAGSVNYVVFGKMCRLCTIHYGQKGDYLNGAFRFTPNAMMDLIRLYKGPYNVTAPLTSSPSRNYKESQLWAYSGFYGWPAYGQPSGDRKNCTPYCSKPIDRPFTLHWAPNHSTETTRRG